MQYALDELDRLIGERSRHRQDYERVLADRDDEFNRLERSDGPTSERWKMHRDNKSRARTEDEAIAGQLGRPVN